jgi:hypothetical protein
MQRVVQRIGRCRRCGRRAGVTQFERRQARAIVREPELREIDAA